MSPDDWLQTPSIGAVSPQRQPPNLPSDPTYEAPQIRADSGRAGSFWVAAAAVAGVHHLRNGVGSQDAYACGHRNDVVVVAVADGLGSQPKSQVGAALATRFATKALLDIAGEDIWADPEEAVRSCIRATNNHLIDNADWLTPEGTTGALATTFAIGLIERIDDRMRGVAGRLGDANVFTMSNSNFTNLFPIDDGPSNVVNARLPALQELAVEVRQFDPSQVTLVLATTDRIVLDLKNSPATRRWLHECLVLPVDKIRLLNALSYRRQGSHDDRTAAVIWPITTTTSLTDGHSNADDPSYARPDAV